MTEEGLGTCSSQPFQARPLNRIDRSAFCNVFGCFYFFVTISSLIFSVYLATEEELRTCQCPFTLAPSFAIASDKNANRHSQHQWLFCPCNPLPRIRLCSFVRNGLMSCSGFEFIFCVPTNGLLGPSNFRNSFRSTFAVLCVWQWSGGSIFCYCYNFGVRNARLLEMQSAMLITAHLKVYL